MTPFIEGKIYPETDKTGLPSLRFDLLLESPEPNLLRQISVLKTYLADVRPVLSIHVYVSEKSFAPAANSLRSVWPFSWIAESTGVSVEFRKTWEKLTSATLKSMVPTALTVNADFICSSTPLDETDIWLVDDMQTHAGDYEAALRACEAFVRGHDVAWSFRDPIWGGTFSTLYPLSEPDFKLFAQLQELLATKQKSDQTLESATEYARRLGYNTLFNLAYSRDKLLFYIQQRKRANREGRFRQHFTMELGYYLNHYYLLLWNGVDQLCWLMNFVFKLGFDPTDKNQRRAVGITKPFLGALEKIDPKLAGVFRDTDFVNWRRILKAARHYAAHQGAVIPTEMYIKPEPDITDEELDKEIDAEGELDFLRGIATPVLIESFRSTIRIRKRLQKYEKEGDILMLEDEDGKKFWIYPLKHTDWDFQKFFELAKTVADSCRAWIESQP